MDVNGNTTSSKTCCDCGSSSLGTKFRGRRCFECNYLRTKEWRKNNPEKVKEHGKNRVVRNRKLLNDIKNVPCMDCNQSFPSYCMDFDHVSGEKKFQIGSRSATSSMTTLFKEMAKCEIVCANCHRKRTYMRKTPKLN